MRCCVMLRISPLEGCEPRAPPSLPRVGSSASRPRPPPSAQRTRAIHPRASGACVAVAVAVDEDAGRSWGSSAVTLFLVSITMAILSDHSRAPGDVEPWEPALAGAALFCVAPDIIAEGVELLEDVLGDRVARGIVDRLTLPGPGRRRGDALVRVRPTGTVGRR